MPLLRYLLNELMDEDGDGVPDQRGIPRAPGMSLGAPSGDERMDDFVGIDQPEMDQFEEEDFDASPLDQFLERMSSGGVPQGLARPRGFGQGLLSGIAQGAVGRGQRVGERRKKFETAQTQRAAERDKANLQATRDYRTQRGTAMRDSIKASRDEAKTTRPATPKLLAEMPWLARTFNVGDRVPISLLTAKPQQTPEEIRVEAYNRMLGGNQADRELPKPVAPKEAKPPDYGPIGALTTQIRTDPDISGFVTVRDAYSTGINAANRNNSAGDIILMRMIAKATDPTTGVREEEFRTFEGAQGTLAKFGVKLTSKLWGSGALTPEGRRQLKGVLEDIYDSKKTQADRRKKLFTRQAQAIGVDPGILFEDQGAELIDRTGRPPLESFVRR